MSINLFDMVKGAVSDQLMGQIGGLLGQSDQAKTKHHKALRIFLVPFKNRIAG